MAKTPKQPKPKQRAAPRAGEAEPGPVAAQNVILERMEEQQRVIIEAVTMTRESLRREMGEMKQELSSRMDTLEFVVRKNSADIQKNSADIQKNSADIQKNSADIQRLSEKLDAHAGRVGAVERRVEALEADAG